MHVCTVKLPNKEHIGDGLFVPVEKLSSSQRISFRKVLNPLTTDDALWRRQFLAACYQLVQSVLKIGSALWDGEVGGWVHPFG